MELTDVTMIEFFVLKQRQEDGVATGNKPASQVRASAAQLCIALDINELNLPKTCQTEFPEPCDLLNFKLVICSVESFHRNGRFMVSFRATPNYPHEPPKGKCDTVFRHPSTHLDGNLLNLLKPASFYRNGRFVFNFHRSPNYPHEPPKVMCVTMVYHPNTDLDGDVCLNISGEDRKHVLTVNSIVYISL
ncbi:hypothetical protein HPB50_000174 [Hyalomma asiaticum]|uniref:Uncharacterized protein n=1 Tax=Hyalomma asiaticum TaxID=266040 RepID=A0ACB7TC20_HYAAI|nr:hypothetical protein HPB50_000174 [Hyalomma asiaticum]